MSNPATPVRRSVKAKFSFQKNCLFCGKLAKYDVKGRGDKFFPVKTKDFQNSLRILCLKHNDSWALKVLARLEFAQDLHAADATIPNSAM